MEMQPFCTHIAELPQYNSTGFALDPLGSLIPPLTLL